MNSDSISNNQGRRKHDIVFQTLMNVYYHEYIENNNSRLLSWTAFISIIFSSTSFLLIGDLIPETFALGKEIIFALLAFCITCLNSVILAFGVSHKMVLHRDLKNKWLELYGKANQSPEKGGDIETLERLFYDLNTLEPPANKKQLEFAYKRTCSTMGLEFPNQ